jgi:hypothetical protein
MDPNVVHVTLSSPVGALNWVQMFTSIFQAIGVIVASSVAVWGISSWRREFQGKRRIELAEDVLAQMYEAKDALTSIRSPFSYEGENAGRQVAENETPLVKQCGDRAYIWATRYEHHQGLFTRLYSMRYRIMALMGKDAAKPIDEIRTINIELLLAAKGLQEMGQHLYTTGNEVSEGYQNRIDDCNTVLGWAKCKEDAIAKRIGSAVSQVEAVCGQVIEGAVTGKRSRPKASAAGER